MTVHISNDPNEVAAVRAAADAEADALYPKALESLRAGDYPTCEEQHALHHRLARAVRDLRAIADDVSVTPEGRVSAAMVLTEIGDAGGAERAASFLAGPSRELRIEALKRLNDGEGDVDWSVPGSVDALLRLIGDDDEHVGLVAANLASLHKVSGATARVLARLDSGRVTDRANWAGALSAVADTPEAAGRAAQELFRDPPDPYWTHSLMYNLFWVCNHPDPGVRAPARAAAREFCLRYLPDERTTALVGDFCQVAGPEDVLLLEEIVATDRPRGYRWVAVAALARIDPARAVDLALARVTRRPLPDGMCLSIFLRHATEADAERIIRLVRPSPAQLADARSDLHLERVVRLLIRLGEAGRAELRRWVDRLSGYLRTRAEWGLHGITLRPVLEALTAAGALPGDADALMTQMRDAYARAERARATSDGMDEGDPSLVAVAFGRAGRAVSFDPGDFPTGSDRDRLRAFTSERTGGLFVPECPVMETHGGNFDSPASVRFIHRGRAFHFETRVFSGFDGGFDDVSAVTGAANAALAASGHPERFLMQPANMSGTVLILTDPAKYRPVAARFHLPADAGP
jgi:hypothetical protein